MILSTAKFQNLAKNLHEHYIFWHGQYLWGRRIERKWSVKNQEKRKVWWSQFTWIWIIPQEIMLTLMTCFVGICTTSSFDTNAQFWLSGKNLFYFFIHLVFEFWNHAFISIFGLNSKNLLFALGVSCYPFIYHKSPNKLELIILSYWHNYYFNCIVFK